jgi:hypothetical protein
MAEAGTNDEPEQGMWAEFFNERRIELRHRVWLPISLALSTEVADAAPAVATYTLGHTWDVSAHGLALVLDTLRVGEQDVIEVGREVQLVLALPAGTLTLRAVVIHQRTLASEGLEPGYLLGVRLTALSAPDRALYDQYLSTLTQR